ncbi:MAG TPA: HAD family hydrolase [Acidimicrobiales bacterium]|nr:HAD family hydrolase [Acidimicrobiales bacterium]
MAWRVVLIDLDDTLVADTDAVEAALLRAAQIARPLGLEPIGLAAAARYHARERWQGEPVSGVAQRLGISSSEALCSDFPGESDDLVKLREYSLEFRIGTWQDALASIGRTDDDLAYELARRFVEERRGHHLLYDDVQPVLDSLARTHRLAVVTNGPADLQREKVEQTGLEMYVDAVVISSEIGVGKPDAAPFLRALELLEVDRSEAVAIGNSPQTDIAGARAAGVASILLDRDGTALLEEIPEAGPDLIIESLLDLPELLESRS